MHKAKSQDQTLANTAHGPRAGTQSQLELLVSNHPYIALVIYAEIVLSLLCCQGCLGPCVFMIILRATLGNWRPYTTAEVLSSRVTCEHG